MRAPVRATGRRLSQRAPPIGEHGAGRGSRCEFVEGKMRWRCLTIALVVSSGVLQAQVPDRVLTRIATRHAAQERRGRPARCSHWLARWRHGDDGPRLPRRGGLLSGRVHVPGPPGYSSRRNGRHRGSHPRRSLDWCGGARRDLVRRDAWLELSRQQATPVWSSRTPA